jgi:hypothetical protein
MTQNEASVSVRTLTRIEHDRQTHEPDTDTAVFPMPLKLAKKMRDMGVVAIITAEVDTAALLGAALTEAGATVVDSTTSDTEQGVTFADAVQQLEREAALQAQVLTLTNQVESLGGELAAAHEDLAELRNTAATDTVSKTGGDSLAGGDAPGNDTLAGGGDLTAGNDSVAAGGDSATSNDAVAAGTKSKSTKAKA